jgi:hypothetical protein
MGTAGLPKIVWSVMARISFAHWAQAKGRLFVPGLLFLTISASLAAQEPAVQKPCRFDLTPLVGYRTGMSFPIQPYVTGTNPRLVLDATPSYGFAFGFRLHEDDVVEFRWARQASHTHFEDAYPGSPTQSATLNQFHGDFSHEYMIEDWRSWARPFVMLSVGATHLSGSAGASFTRFSFGMGGGVKFFVGRHLGFRMQAQWLPVLVDPYGVAVCGAGCVVHIGGTLSSQGEVAVGPMIRF